MFSVGVGIPEFTKLGMSLSSFSEMAIPIISGSLRFSVFFRRRFESPSTGAFNWALSGVGLSGFAAFALFFLREVLFFVPLGRPRTLETL